MFNKYEKQDKPPKCGHTLKSYSKGLCQACYMKQYLQNNKHIYTKKRVERPAGVTIFTRTQRRRLWCNTTQKFANLSDLLKAEKVLVLDVKDKSDVTDQVLLRAITALAGSDEHKGLAKAIIKTYNTYTGKDR